MHSSSLKFSTRQRQERREGGNHHASSNIISRKREINDHHRGFGGKFLLREK